MTDGRRLAFLLLTGPAAACIGSRGQEDTMGKGRVLKGFTAMFVGITAAVAVSGSVLAQSELRLNGSTTVTANVVQGKEKGLEAAAGAKLAIVSNGSGKGLADLVAGRADVAMLSSPLADVAKKNNL